MNLEDLRRGAQVTGIIPYQAVTIIEVKWHGENVVGVLYRRADGKTDETLIYRDHTASLHIVENGHLWSFGGDGELLRLVSEAF